MTPRAVLSPSLLLVVAAFFPLALAAQTAPAESAYVTDVLRLGLYQAEDATGRPFRTLVSGTQVEILERRTFYARVRTPDGEVGWVKSNFLQDEKPAALRATEYETRISELTGDLQRVQAELDEANGTLSGIRSETSDVVGLTQEAESLRSEKERLEDRLASFRGSLPIKWSLILAAVLAVLGFIGGIAFLDYRIRKRHGGFRVY